MEKKNWQTDSESEGVVPERIAGVNGRLFIYSALILCRFYFIFTHARPSHESQTLYLWTHVGFAGQSSHTESKHTSARAYSADYVTNGSSFWSSASHCYFIYLFWSRRNCFFFFFQTLYCYESIYAWEACWRPLWTQSSVWSIDLPSLGQTLVLNTKVNCRVSMKELIRKS